MRRVSCDLGGVPDEPEPQQARGFREFLRDRAATITSRAREAGFFSHMPTRGVAREEVLLAPLREILPARWLLMTGEVRAYNGAVSNQWDILICEARDTPRLLESGSSVVVPVETVRAAVSVKSQVTAASIREAVAATSVLRTMPRREISVSGMRLVTPEPSPAVFLFGFQGTGLTAIKDALTAAVRAEPAGALNGVCLHGQGMAVPIDASGPTPTLHGERAYGYVETGDGSYGVFVSMLYVALHAQPVHAPDLVAYVDLGRMAGHRSE